MKNDHHSLSAPGTLGMLVLGLLLSARVAGAAAPRVTTLTASNVTATVATLKGTVNPGSVNTTAWFEWGLGNAMMNRTTPTNVGSGSGTLAFSASGSNLTSGIIYRVRAVASNSLGVVRGVALPFGVPTVMLNGAGAQTNAQYAPYVEPGAVASGLPAAMAVGDSHILALRADGHVVGWGLNSSGQATVPSAATNVVAVAAGYIHSLALRADGVIVGWGTNLYDQLSIPGDATNVVALAAGFAHSLALRSDGTVAGWGSDDYGQVTVPEEATNVVSIAAGYSHSLALRSDGSMVEWGEFYFGPADMPVEASNIVAIADGFSHSLALRANGTVVAWGDESTGAVTVPASASNVVAIAAGYSHSLALRADGTVVGWGTNNYGEINIPAAATNVIAIGAGFAHSQALRADGTVIGWGNPQPSAGQTTTPTNLIAYLPVTITGTVNTAVTGAYSLFYRATNVFGFPGTATRTVQVLVLRITSQSRLGNGSFQFGADFIPGTTLTVLATTNAALPLAGWTVLGTATENPAGHYEFTDTNAPGQAKRFYRLRLD